MNALSNGSIEARVYLSRSEGLDESELEERQRFLQRELADLPIVEWVERPRGGSAEPGTKAGEALALGALVVAVAPVVLPVLIEFLKEWSLRPGNRPLKVKVARGDRSTEVEYDPRTLTAEEVKALVATLQTGLQD